MNPEIVKRFNVFRAKTGKYADLELDKVEFENHPLVGSDLITFNPPKDVDKINELIRKNETASKIPMDCIEPNRGMIENPQSGKVSELNSKSYRYFEDGDVIFAKVTPCMENGNCAIADGLVNGIGFGSTEFYVFRTTQALHNIYLWYYLRQQALRDEAKKTMTGAGGLKRVPKSFFERTYLPIPKALNEQYSSVTLQQIIVEFIEFHTQRHEHNLSKINRIGAMWDKVESLVLPLTFAKEKSAAQRFNIFCQKNGYELKLEEVEFEGKELRELVELPVRSGGTPDTKTETYWADNFNIIDNKNYFGWRNIDKELFKNKYIDQFSKTITKMGFNSSSTWLVPENSILIAIASASKGLLTINRKPMCTNQNILGVVLSSSYLTDYVYYVLKDIYSTLEGKREYGNLTKGSEERRRILLPKKASKFDSFKLQNIIAEFFEHYLDKVKHYKDKVALLNHLIPRYNQTFITTTFNAMKRQAQ